MAVSLGTVRAECTNFLPAITAALVLLLLLPPHALQMARAVDIASLASLTAPISLATFSAGVSETRLPATETLLLNHSLTPGAGIGSLTYLWATGDNSVATTTIRIYVDGEATPSLVFEMAKYCGVGCV